MSLWSFLAPTDFQCPCEAIISHLFNGGARNLRHAKMIAIAAPTCQGSSGAHHSRWLLSIMLGNFIANRDHAIPKASPLPPSGLL